MPFWDDITQLYFCITFNPLILRLNSHSAALSRITTFVLKSMAWQIVGADLGNGLLNVDGGWVQAFRYFGLGAFQVGFHLLLASPSSLLLPL
jgi:hypothetical protein